MSDPTVARTSTAGAGRKGKASVSLRQSKKERRPVWVLIGHYRRKPSELLGVYREYERGKSALDAAAICGDYHEVALTTMQVLL